MTTVLTGSSGQELPELTDREIEIVTLVSLGLSNREIGKALFLSEDTIKTYMLRAYRKWGIHDRAGLACQAMRSGVIQ